MKSSARKKRRPAVECTIPHQEHQQREKSETQASKRAQEFSEAVDRVYRIYGADLPRFFRDAEKEQELFKREG